MKGTMNSATYVQAFDCALRLPVLDGLGDFRLELCPIIERTKTQELDERIQLVHIILHGSSGQTPTVLSFQRATRLSGLRRLVLDVVRLV